MTKKIMGQLLPRKRYTGAVAPATYYPSERMKLNALLGGAVRFHLHVRVYDKASAGAPQLDIQAAEGCFGDEPAREANTPFGLAVTGAVPSAPPWLSAGALSNLPADLRVTFTPVMGYADVAIIVIGTAATWVEFEVWFTAEYAT